MTPFRALPKPHCCAAADLIFFLGRWGLAGRADTICSFQAAAQAFPDQLSLFLTQALNSSLGDRLAPKLF